LGARQEPYVLLESRLCAAAYVRGLIGRRPCGRNVPADVAHTWSV